MKKCFAIALLALACAKKNEPAAPAPTTTTTASSNAAAAPPAGTPDLLSIANGAFPIELPPDVEGKQLALNLFDEDSATGWTSSEDKAAGGVALIEMPAESIIKTVTFDDSHPDYDEKLPKEIVVETSATSATANFEQILDVTLPKERKDGQTFAVASPRKARWVRITIKSNYGGPHTQLQEVRAFGDRMAEVATPNVAGSWETKEWEWFYLKQNGASVTGCYAAGHEPLIGGLEGRILKFKWNSGSNNTGPAFINFASDGKRFLAGWMLEHAEHPTWDFFWGEKKSDTPGTCPDEKPPEQTLASTIRKEGRVRLYGINFDSDSDRIRPESKTTLDEVVKMLRENADLKITIEGHTDSTATAEHNQQLSEQRANAVKGYLTSAGIDGGRLNTVGFGATKPVASNDTALGRAANRRVELAKQ